MRRLVLIAAALAACAGSAKEVRETGLRDATPYEFHRALADTFMRTGQPRQAIEHIRELQHLKPSDAEPYLLMGRAYTELGVAASAREMFDRAVALDPKLAAAHESLGILADRVGDHGRAEAEHRRALALAPDRASFHNNLGFCLYLQGRFAEAATAYERALALDGGSRRTHNNVGFAYGRGGDLDRAYTHFKLAGGPGQAENNMGLVHEARGDLERAYDLYRTALAADPKLDEAQANLARVCERLGRPVPALPVHAARAAAPRGQGASP